MDDGKNIKQGFEFEFASPSASVMRNFVFNLSPNWAPFCPGPTTSRREERFRGPKAARSVCFPLGSHFASPGILLILKGTRMPSIWVKVIEIAAGSIVGADCARSVYALTFAFFLSVPRHYSERSSTCSLAWRMALAKAAASSAETAARLHACELALGAQVRHGLTMTSRAPCGHSGNL